MRIVIDMQGAQTISRFRGIGRYTLSFAQAIVRNRGKHEVILALSGSLPETIQPIRDSFQDLLPQENIRVWEAPCPVKEEHPDNDIRRLSAELLREAYLASLQPDLIHICSLFEGYVDDAVVSIGRFDSRTLVSVTVHDLIPLRNPEQYLNGNPRYACYYQRKLAQLKQADCFLAISEYSRQEGIHCLGVTASKVVNTLEAVDPVFQILTLAQDNVQGLKARLGITRPFILYTGGDDERKNLPRLIEAYAALPEALRSVHQLVFVGPIGRTGELRQIAQDAGLQPEDFFCTGHVSDEELVQLYNLCQLYVFPSWHEGFGLPPLEAMSCGAPVIGANTTSLPEVIGFEEALFDPFSVSDITVKLQHALTDKAFTDRLREHGRKHAQKFSWDDTAKRAIASWESLQRPHNTSYLTTFAEHSKLKLAFVSPLPPERTGIADYSAELLPVLSEYYQIDVVVDQKNITDPWIMENCPVRTSEWFRENYRQYDRVLYHFGNNSFHQYTFPLLETMPGVVVLHDFFQSGIQAYRDDSGSKPHALAQALYTSHGYRAVVDRYVSSNPWEDVVMGYPANLPVLQRGLGVIAHGEYSRKLASQWYGPEAAADWAVIPHLRVPADPFNRDSVRRQLGFRPNDLIVCSFGFLGPTKLNHRLLASFLASPLAANPEAKLVFVGSNEHGGEYGKRLIQSINSSDCASRIYITEWADTKTFRAYLAAADIAVQLRTLSRGETSGTILDCMNHGIASIVNAHGSLADMDKKCVWMLQDDFTDNELISALTALADDSQLRRDLGIKAQETIRTKHHPKNCAQEYMEAIERFYRESRRTLRGILPELAKIHLQERDILSLASSLADDYPPTPRQPQLLLDISELVYHDAKTGIQRVVRSILREWLENPPEGYRVEPIYATPDSEGYRYARRYICQFLDIPDTWAQDGAAKAWTGDIFLGLEVAPDLLAIQQPTLQRWHNRGVQVWFLVYDLLPIRTPEVFPPESTQGFFRWIETVSNFDGAVCITKSVAQDLQKFVQERCIQRQRKRPFHVRWFHLGADIDNSSPTHGLPSNADNILTKISARKSFLMVGTIEPRKGYIQTIEAFNQLWQSEEDVNLVIVGKEGWKQLPYEKRRVIPTIMEKLKNHPELHERLFVLEGISDEYLEKIYFASTSLIAASYGEGFGLPLIEAARHKVPVIARDIPVFKEVAGKHAYYFANSKNPEIIAQAVKDWLLSYQAGVHPVSETMPWLTWKESASNLFSAIFKSNTSLVPSFSCSGSEYNEKDSMLYAENSVVPKPIYANERAEKVIANIIRRQVHKSDIISSKSTTFKREDAHACVQSNEKLRVGWITTWNVRCGIAVYSEHLLKNASETTAILASHAAEKTGIDTANVWRCWSIGDQDNLIGLIDTIDQLYLNSIVIQFNYGFFNLKTLRDFVLEQINCHRIVVITLHATIDPAHEPYKKLSILSPALKSCHKVLVHTPADIIRLNQLGIVNNVEIIPHGVIDYTPSFVGLSMTSQIFKIASYGFFLPHKGLLELIDAIAILSMRGIDLQLEMVNAEFPAQESKQIIVHAKHKIVELGLQKRVTIITDFLSDKESLDRLSEADLIVFPYQKTAESSSAAVRYGIASCRPVAVTPLTIFDDVRSAVHYLPGISPEKIADGINFLMNEIANKTDMISEKEKSAHKWRENNNYSRVSSLIYQMLNTKFFGIVNQRVTLMNSTCIDSDMRSFVNEKSNMEVEGVNIPLEAPQPSVTKIGIVLVTYSMVPDLLVKSIISKHDCEWFVFHHGSPELMHDIENLFLDIKSNLYFYNENRGLAKSWNEGILSAITSSKDIILVLNDDVEFIEDGFDLWVDYILENDDSGLIFITGEEPQDDGTVITRQQNFACFYIGQQAIELVGAFDENFKPAYFEDYDYICRAQLAGIKASVDSRSLCRHRRSSTIKNDSEIREKLSDFWGANCQYFIKKWGCEEPGSGCYSNPFNDSSIGSYLPFKTD